MANLNNIRIKEINIELSNKNIFTFNTNMCNINNIFEFNQVINNKDIVKHIIHVSDNEYVELNLPNEFDQSSLFLIDNYIELQIHPRMKSKSLTFIRGYFDFLLEISTLKIQSLNNKEQTIKMEDFWSLLQITSEFKRVGDIKIYLLDKFEDCKLEIMHDTSHNLVSFCII